MQPDGRVSRGVLGLKTEKRIIIQMEKELQLTSFGVEVRRVFGFCDEMPEH